MPAMVNGVSDLGNWANSKSCGPWKADRGCGHPGCEQDQRAVDVLSALVEISPGEWMLRESDVTFTT